MAPNLDTNENVDTAGPLPDNEEDKKLKKKILLDTILDKLRGSNDGHEVLKQLRQAVDSGENLNADVLSGGYTNYSYKVYVEGNPDLCIFAKVRRVSSQCPEASLRTLYLGLPPNSLLIYSSVSSTHCGILIGVLFVSGGGLQILPRLSCLTSSRLTAQMISKGPRMSTNSW